LAEQHVVPHPPLGDAVLHRHARRRPAAGEFTAPSRISLGLAGRSGGGGGGDGDGDGDSAAGRSNRVGVAARNGKTNGEKRKKTESPERREPKRRQSQVFFFFTRVVVIPILLA
jgi:hypothetical protein